MPDKRYKAMVGLAYPTDPAIIRRIKAGEDVPWEERKVKEVKAGQVVDDIPASSIPALLKRGQIKAVGAAAEVDDD